MILTSQHSLQIWLGAVRLSRLHLVQIYEDECVVIAAKAKGLTEHTDVDADATDYK